MIKNQSNKFRKRKTIFEQNLIRSDIYLNEVFDPVKNIYEKIKVGMKNDDLDIMILSAPMIGKTASLLKAKDLFEKMMNGMSTMEIVMKSRMKEQFHLNHFLRHSAKN